MENLELLLTPMGADGSCLTCIAQPCADLISTSEDGGGKLLADSGSLYCSRLFSRSL